MIFPARKDGIYRIVFYLIFVAMLFSILDGIKNSSWLSVSVITLLSIFLIWIWVYTKYTITPDYVKIRMGPYERKIAIDDIRSVRQTKNVFSSFALSTNRLEIVYCKYYNVTYIAPKQADMFIRMIRDINPHITVKKFKK